ncbi:hypothetical protein ACSVIJ_00025 [Pseudomonas sp. NCHU5208]|uniref:hypothetical protein n=1 Tax=unclassified Pseudomonas TaxID=196821 RepID=UPI003F96C67D
MGSNDNLDNLVRTGNLKAEAPDRKECEGLLRSAIDRLQDAKHSALSFASRFDLAYNAAHALALTALRLQGYRSDRRYLVFQCLTHTLAVSKAQVRLFALCHDRRNLAEYEGYMDVDEPLLAELVAATDALLPEVQKAMAMVWPA